MKAILLLAMMLSSGSLFAQTNPTKEEITQIFQKCIDLPSLELHFARAEDGTFKQLSILYGHPSPVPTDILLLKDNKQVRIRELLSTNITEDHFQVKSFIISNNTATVQLDFYRQTDSGNKKITISVSLQKADGNWTITNSAINN